MANLLEIKKLANDNKIEILEGLKAGDKIVEEGIRLVKDQQLVKNI